MASTGTWHVYAAAVAKLANKEIDWDSDTIKAALCTSAYTPNQATHDYFNDVTNEVTGTGYTAGGNTLTTKTITLATLTQKFDADDLLWASSSITARVIVIYDSTPGTAATNPLIAYCVLSGDETSVAGNWPHTFDANGIFSITVA